MIENATSSDVIVLVVVVLVLAPPAIATIYASALTIIDRLLDRTKKNKENE
jgi:hypothetical protein